jgi:hypothetical protein
MIVLGIDPGVRTGVAYLDVPEDAAPVLIAYEEVYGGVSGFKKWWATHPPYDVLVCEDFILRGGVKGVNIEPVRIIEFLAPFGPIMQPPAGREKSVSNAALKRLGLYLPGERLRNAREAVRHAVWHVKKSLHKPTLRVGWPS